MTAKWIGAIRAVETRTERLRGELSRAADERAALIAAAVAAHGRGGRAAVADQLGISARAVDVAIRRSRGGRR